VEGGHSCGFGLPGVRRLMDELEIASEPGKGTTVTVYLPAAKPPDTGPESADAATSLGAEPAPVVGVG